MADGFKPKKRFKVIKSSLETFCHRLKLMQHIKSRSSELANSDDDMDSPLIPVKTSPPVTRLSPSPRRSKFCDLPISPRVPNSPRFLQSPRYASSPRFSENDASTSTPSRPRSTFLRDINIPISPIAVLDAGSPRRDGDGGLLGRVPQNLTAAERLKLLQEPMDAPAVPQRQGSGNILAARREQYLSEANAAPFQQVHRSEPSAVHHSPNFSELDSAVQELQTGVRATGYSNGARRLGGCARFPTDEHAFSPPPRVSTMTRRIDSPPSPTDSDASSVYQVPNGLPHPKPKHNIKEQMYQVGLQLNYYPRTGLKASPNFPVPSTGSVASRITEFERRPGTPTLQIAGSAHAVPTPAPMSPRSTVFRTKPVIHVDLGSYHQRPAHHASAVFQFPTPRAPLDRSLTISPAPLAIDESFNRSPRQNGHNESDDKRFKSFSSTTSNDSRHEDSFGKNRSEGDSSSTTSDSSGSMDLSKSIRGIQHHLSNGVPKKLLNEIPEDDAYYPAPLLPPPLPKAQPKLIDCPRFHFPQGKPVRPIENEAALRRAAEVFKSFPNQSCMIDNMGDVCTAVGLPVYWKRPIFNCLSKGEQRPVTLRDFTCFWKAMTSVAHDEAARFVYALTGGSGSKLNHDHFVPLVMDVILTHPGLEFYRSATEFHDKYCDVVITRIFWNVGRPWSSTLNAQDIRRSDLLEKIKELETDEDINKNLRYFSYEHFYVIYCLFWEIDTDHDLRISRADLMNHDKGAFPPMIVERIFSPAVCRCRAGDLRYIDISAFTRLLLADEDKTHPSSIEYWFRILDEDGDGAITLYEMERFYRGVQQKLTEEGVETLQFSDVVCNLIDAIMPEDKTMFRLKDLKRNRLAPRFFNSLCNWRKFLIQETTEASDTVRLEDDSGRELSAWDRYCAEQYEVLMDATSDVEGDEVVDSFEVYLDDDDDRRGVTSYSDLL